jgi:hypothetical protein
VIHVYAFTDSPDGPPPPLRGLGDEPIAQLGCDGLGVVVTRHARLDPGPDPRAVVRHDAVVSGLLRAGAVLPARFGTRYRDDDQLIDAVRPRAGALAERLSAVRGRVELGVHAWEAAPAGAAGMPSAPKVRSVAPTSGRDYLRDRLDQYRRTGRLTAMVMDGVAAYAIERAPARPARDGGVAFTFLVEHDRVGAFVAAVDRIATSQADVRLVCTGPWAPYSFTGDAPRGVDAWRP